MTDNETAMNLLGSLLPDQPVKEEKKRNNYWDWNPKTEIIDIDEGLVYQKKRGNKKGKVLRKWCEVFGSYRDEVQIRFWRPRLKNLAACEASRWHAIQYSNNQRAKYNGFFESVLKEAPFRCIIMTPKWPGFEWYYFDKHKIYGYRDNTESLSTGYIRHRDSDQDKYMAFPIKQDVGDAYFAYEKRFNTIRKRTGYFEHLFTTALCERYSHEFYSNSIYRSGYIIRKLLINNREYLIGDKDRERFGVIAYPENVVTEVVT